MNETKDTSPVKAEQQSGAVGRFRAVRCLRAQGGLIAFVEFPKDYADTITNADISLGVTNAGFNVVVKNIEIAVPEVLMEHFCANPFIAVFPSVIEQYAAEPLFNIVLARDMVVEANGIYKFQKAQGAAAER